jgi:hypothetical protein
MHPNTAGAGGEEGGRGAGGRAPDGTERKRGEGNSIRARYGSLQLDVVRYSSIIMSQKNLCSITVQFSSFTSSIWTNCERERAQSNSLIWLVWARLGSNDFSLGLSFGGLKSLRSFIDITGLEYSHSVSSMIPNSQESYLG